MRRPYEGSVWLPHVGAGLKPALTTPALLVEGLAPDYVAATCWSLQRSSAQSLITFAGSG